MPGMTMSMKMRSGLISLARRRPSAPSAAAAVRYPCFSSAFCMTCTSVGESSTISISGIPLSPDMRLDRAQELVLGERLGEVVLRADDSTPGPIEQPVLGGQHDDGNGTEYLVVLDEGTGLIAIEARHHDVDEHDVRLVIGDLGQRIESVNRSEDFATLFRKQGFRRTTDSLAVVDDQYLETLEFRVAAGHGQATPSLTAVTIGHIVGT